MKKFLLMLCAIVPLGAAVIVLQSCGGQGGPTTTGTGGGPTQAFLALLPVGQKTATYIGSDKCATCHADNHTEWQATKHAANNVGCERCHGPGSLHAANPGTQAIQRDPTTANVLTFPNSTSPVVCAQCHGPIYDQWNTSLHATYVEAGNPGSPALNLSRSSRCIVCHNGLARTQTYEQGLDIGDATQVPDATLAAIATNFLNVPHTAACATCHDPHALNPNALDQDGEDHQLRHPPFNQDTVAQTTGNGTLVGGYGANTGPNSTAASFTQFDHTCAECHNGRGVTPTDAKLVAGTSRFGGHDSPQFNMLMGFGAVEGAVPPVTRNTAHADAPAQCSHCHMGNADHSFTVHYDTACAPCHTAADAAARATSVKGETANSLFALETRMSNWAVSKGWGPDAWMYTSDIPAGEVAPPDQTNTTVPLGVKRARHNYYMVIRDLSMGVHNHAYTRFILDEANTELDNAGIAAVPADRLNQISTSQKFQVLKQQLAQMQIAEHQNPPER